MGADTAAAVAAQLQGLNIDDNQRRPASKAATVAGMDTVLAALRELIGWPALWAAQGQALGVTWPRGLLLHGPPGTGKTAAVQAVAAEFGATVHTITAGSVLGSATGESERRLREAFAAAAAGDGQGSSGGAPGAGPVVVFLDELDALCPRRSSGRPHEARVVAQLLTLLDGAAGTQPGGRPLAVVGATNRPNAIDPALRRPGRLDREIAVTIPSATERAEILRLHSAGLPLAADVDLDKLAVECNGYTGADLAALCREAAMAALTADVASTTAGEEQAGEHGGTVGNEAFQAARVRVPPSVNRGALTDSAPVRWDDIGGLQEVKQRLRQAVEWPLRHRAAFQRLNLAPPRGALLHGPPGCCKTTLARAAATASGATMVELSGAQLFSMYVGEGEALLRGAFQRARLAAPSILFLDELDALVGSRSDEGDGGQSSAAARLLSSLLTEMDGLELATGVLVLAATNRPRAVDAALLRPGRFDLLLYVPLPDCEGRLQTLRIHSRSMPLTADVDLASLAGGTHLYTGAELQSLCREAAHAALREDLQGARFVAMRHFDEALAASKPGLTEQTLRGYAAWPL